MLIFSACEQQENMYCVLYGNFCSSEGRNAVGETLGLGDPLSVWVGCTWGDTTLRARKVFTTGWLWTNHRLGIVLLGPFGCV